MDAFLIWEKSVQLNYILLYPYLALIHMPKVYCSCNLWNFIKNFATVSNVLNQGGIFFNINVQT